ncbi:hypothetical protein FXO38_33912 [Capsicum annuum]|nr:hypothetical protein FXO38_33912 [Capsicum annuum]
MSYSLAEVNRRLALSKTPGRDTTFNDLKIEVEQLKREIVSLKQNQMISDHRISKIEEKIIEISETSFTSKGKDKDLEYSENDEIDKLSPTEDLKRDYFLGMMQIVTAHKWYINWTILINKEFSVTNVAMIDSGADVSCIQEGLIPTSKLKKDEVAIVLVPFPAQGHLNQLLQLACLISSSYDLPIYYVGSATHNRQAQVRANSLAPSDIAKIHFHDIPTPEFDSTPPPDYNALRKFSSQIQPLWDASMLLPESIASFLRDISSKARRCFVLAQWGIILSIFYCMSHNIETLAIK